MLNLNSRKLRTNLHDIGQAVNVITTGRWIFYCFIIGVICGACALLFSLMLDVISQLALRDLAGVTMVYPGEIAGPSGQGIVMEFEQYFMLHWHWLIVLIPAFGGLVAGLLIYRIAPEAKGHGNDAVIRAYHKNNGSIRPTVPLVKMVASAFTIGTGGSAGKEGPIAQVGAGIGSYFATRLGMSVHERKILLMAGMAASIGAIFKAPIGSALFVTEVMYVNDFESEGLVASIIAAIVGYTTYALVDGWESIFIFESISFRNPVELPLFIVLAVIAMVVGMIYTKIFHGTGRIFAKLSLPAYLKPVLGGLMVGGVAFFYPAVLGTSYGYLQSALNGDLTITFMAGLILMKIITTSITIQSGGSGGVFGPTLVIGGLVGGIVGYGIEAVIPGTLSNPDAFVLVGMAAFLAGVANVPVSATIMISEMSKSYGLVVPLVFASAITYLGTSGWSMYKEQLRDHRASASYRDEFLHDILLKLKVRTAYQKVEHMPEVNIRSSMSEVLRVFTRAETLILPVMDDDAFVGVISLHDVRELFQQDVGDVIIAADVMEPPKALHLNDSLNEAFNFFKEHEAPEILVYQPGSDADFIGVLDEKDFLLAYERAMSSEEGA